MNVRAFEIVSAAECDRAFAKGAPPAHNRALPITSASWQRMYSGKLPERAGEQATSNPWWMDVQFTDDTATCVLWVPPDLPCFAGHFPGQPILPGVLQLQWGVQLASLAWPERASDTMFAGTARVKFKAPVLPDSMLRLKLSATSKQTATRINLTLGSKTSEHTTLGLLYRD